MALAYVAAGEREPPPPRPFHRIVERPYAGVVAIGQWVLCRRYGRFALIRAGEVEVADSVWDPTLREWSGVTRVSAWSAEVFAVQFADGRCVEVSGEHRFHLGDRLLSATELEPADAKVVSRGLGEVVAIDCVSGEFQLSGSVLAAKSAAREHR